MYKSYKPITNESIIYIYNHFITHGDDDDDDQTILSYCHNTVPGPLSSGKMSENPIETGGKLGSCALGWLPTNPSSHVSNIPLFAG